MTGSSRLRFLIRTHTWSVGRVSDAGERWRCKTAVTRLLSYRTALGWRPRPAASLKAVLLRPCRSSSSHHVSAGLGTSGCQARRPGRWVGLGGGAVQLHGSAAGVRLSSVAGHPLPRVAAQLRGGEGHDGLGGLPGGWRRTHSG